MASVYIIKQRTIRTDLDRDQLVNVENLEAYSTYKKADAGVQEILDHYETAAKRDQHKYERRDRSITITNFRGVRDYYFDIDAMIVDH